MASIKNSLQQLKKKQLHAIGILYLVLYVKNKGKKAVSSEGYVYMSFGVSRNVTCLNVVTWEDIEYQAKGC